MQNAPRRVKLLVNQSIHKRLKNVYNHNVYLDVNAPLEWCYMTLNVLV